MSVAECSRNSSGGLGFPPCPPGLGLGPGLARLGLGWAPAIRLYNAVVISLLSHVGQVLLAPSMHLILPKVIPKALRTPFRRLPPWAAFLLKTLHFPVEMIDPLTPNRAAMSRVRLHSASVVSELENLLAHASDVDPCPLWAPQLMVRQISRALDEVNNQISPPPH